MTSDIRQFPKLLLWHYDNKLRSIKFCPKLGSMHQPIWKHLDIWRSYKLHCLKWMIIQKRLIGGKWDIVNNKTWRDIEISGRTKRLRAAPLGREKQFSLQKRRAWKNDLQDNFSINSGRHYWKSSRNIL